MVEIYQDMRESLLVERVCAGDQGAFGQLIQRYQALVWRTVCVLVPDRGAAEDLVQEVWTDVWRGLPTFHQERPFRPWLLAIVAHRAHKRARRPTLLQQPLESVAPELLIEANEPLDQYLSHEAYQELRAHLAQLPADQQRVLALRYFGELELAEIAEMMGTSIGTVKSRLHRALARLRATAQSVQAAIDS